MRRQASLLSRIRHPELAAPRRHVPTNEVRDDILRHLRKMCMTRQGSMVTRPDYGIPDVSEMLHNFPEAIATMQRALKHTIQTYEPRLANVHVTFVPSDDLIIHFEVTAQLIAEGGRSPLKFETTMEMSRKVSVR